MNRKILILALSAVAAAALLGGGFLWWKTAQRNRIVAASVPATPSLAGLNPELSDRITACTHDAKAGVRPVDALGELSSLYFANGFYPQASACYRGLIQVDSSNPIWAHRLATILAQYGDLDHALPLWKWVIQVAPDHIQAAVRLGDALLKDNRTDQAEAAYKGALERDKGNPYAELGLARIAIARQKWSEARTLLEAASAKTNYAIGGNLLVTVYEHLGMADQARALRGMTKSSGAFFDIPDPWIDDVYTECYDVFRLITASGVAQHSNNLPLAIRICERAIELNPRDGYAEYQMGCLYQANSEPLKAMTAIKRCITSLPEFADGWYKLYELQRDTGDDTGAQQTLAAGLQTCPNSPGLHLEYGRRLAAAGNLAEAMAEFKRSAQLRPQEADAYLELATTYFRLDQTGPGIDALHAAIEAQPGHPAALSALAMCMIKLGREAEARKWMAEIALQPRIGDDLRQQLANAYRLQFGHAP